MLPHCATSQPLSSAARFPFFCLSVYPVLRFSVLNSTTYLCRTQRLTAACCPSHSASILSTLVCHGKFRALEKYHGKKTFSQQRPQATNPGPHLAAPLDKTQNFIEHSTGGLLSHGGLRVDFISIQIKYFRKKKTNLETRKSEDSPAASKLLSGQRNALGLATGVRSSALPRPVLWLSHGHTRECLPRHLLPE